MKVKFEINSSYFLLAALSVGALLAPPAALPAQGLETDEFREADAAIDGFTIHYRIGGKGPFLLMLHGFTLTGEQWMPFARALKAHYTVVVADLPGHGGSSPMLGGFSFERSAELMNGLLRHLGARQAYGIGHSGGGITLLHMAAQEPQQLDAMILVAGPHYMNPYARAYARSDRFELLDRETKEFYYGLHPGGEDQVDFIFEQYYGLADNAEVVTPEMLASLSVRTLLVWGDRDEVLPLDIPLEMYRLLPHASLWVIPEQGHVPIWPEMGGDPKAAERFLEIAGDFLARPEEQAFRD